MEDWIHWNEKYFETKLLPVGSLRLSEDIWNQVQNLAWPERKKKHNKVHEFVVIFEQLLMLHSKGAVQQQLSFKKTESLQDLT